MFRDCPCIWSSPSLGTRGLADIRCICPFCPKESVGRKGQIYWTPCPERGILPDTWAIPKHTSGKHRSGGTKFLTNFCAPFFKEIPSFFCGLTPSKTLATPQPLNIAFPLGNGRVLRSEEGGGFRKEGDGKEGEKRRKKGRAKSAQILVLKQILVSGDSCLALSEGQQGPLETLSGDSVSTFWLGELLTPLPDLRECNPRHYVERPCPLQHTVDAEMITRLIPHNFLV